MRIVTFIVIEGPDVEFKFLIFWRNSNVEMKQNGDKHFLCLNNEQTDLEEVLGVANTAEGEDFCV